MSSAFDLVDPTPDSAAWWDGCRGREFLLQRCAACGAYQHYPRTLCTTCRGSELELVRGAERGTVYSHSTVHRGEHPVLGSPYVVALVRLEEGPLILTNIVGDDAAKVSCGDSVSLEWLAAADGRHVPVYAPDPSPSGS